MVGVPSAIIFDPDTQQLVCQGEWHLANVSELKTILAALTWPTSGTLTIDGHAIIKMDSAGAWLLDSLLKKVKQQGATIYLHRFPEQYLALLKLVGTCTEADTGLPSLLKLSWLANIGKSTLTQLSQFRCYLAFVGQLSLEALRITRQPQRIRWSALAGVINKAGYQALPIIGLLSFMIGVVIAYQMGVQLRNYGANIYIVDLLGLSILREFGPLITAIMVAGRTGSAFTAQLGMMKINQEIDALNTMGVTPSELLLLPRLLGLFISLPLLTMWSDVFGAVGGMFMANNMLGITPYDFLHRFGHVIPLRALLIGLGKAPVFALIIASIGCFQGMQVAGDADSVGRNTTRSVVLAIFFIIVVDAVFSVIFSWLKL
jgi:phospholipid/cholesterol/gamma-HCH transport system permease protein